MPEQREPGRATGGGAGASGRAPDFFDRLLARHTPSADHAAAPVRVRPRLPEPFERVAAVGTADRGPATQPSPAPAPGRAAVPPPGEPGHGPWEIRTEHERTVVRAQRTPGTEDPATRAAAPPGTEPPLLRPTATPEPRWHPAEAARQVSGRAVGTVLGPLANERPGPPSTGAPLVPPPGVGALRPAAAPDAAFAARGAARAAAARRGPRATERVVHVQIGRLEVSAAAPAVGPEPRPRAAARRSATVSLEDYLSGRGRASGGGT